MKIANKIVSFILAAAVFPFMLTQTLVKLVLSVNENSLAYSLIKMLFGSDNNLTNNRLRIEESAADLFNLLTGKTKSNVGVDFKQLLSSLPAEFDSIKRLMIVSFAFIAAGLLIAIVIIGCVLFTDAYKTIAALGLGGGVCFFVSSLVFGRAAKPLVDGTISVVDILSKAMETSEADTSSFAAGLLSDAISVDSFALGGAVFFAMFALFGLAIWEISYVVTLPKPDRKKA